MTPTKKLIGILSLSYKKQDLPENLEEHIANCFSDEQKKFKQKEILKKTKHAGFSFLGVFVLFFGFANLMPKASGASSWPILGPLVELVSIDTYTDATAKQSASIKGAALKSTTPLAARLNAKYLQQATDEYAAFKKEVGDNPDDYFTMNTAYTKVTDDERFLVVEHKLEKTKANTLAETSYDTVDKENNTVLSLPLLFKDTHFIKLISAEVKQQMLARKSTGYWQTSDNVDDTDVFQSITKNQKFYINADHELVIVFDQYEIGAGYLGNPKFVIPTSVIKDDLVDTNYLN